MTVALMSVTAVQQDAFALNTGMSLTATASDGSNIISVSGETASKITDVTFIVRTPDGANIVAVDQVTPNADGIFNAEFNTSNWKQDGMYTITAKQGSSSLYTIALSVEVTGGMTTSTSTTESSVGSTINELPNTETMTTDKEVIGLSINANAVEGSDTIGVTGHTSKTNEDVTFTVTSPNGNLVSINQITPESSGDFAIDIATGGPLWSQDGMYTVSAQQGDGDTRFTDSVQVDILDGLVVPEFGTIAAMILAVAIISIIAISSKSRLSIIPRY
jgi:predicted secreted protein with PEFG-CTERM motif